MNFSDEILMAYADGELDADTRRAVEDAMASDASIAERIAQHRALRAELGAAFGGVLKERIPDRLRDAAGSSPSRDAVTDLGAVRAARRAATGQRRWAWKQWTAIAASVLLAVFVGRTILQSPSSQLVASSGNGLRATGLLAEALSTQLAGELSTTANVTIVATFHAKSGEYCRAFTAQSPEGLAGVACRAEDAWRIHTLTQNADRGESEYRTAGSSLPPIVLQTVESMMAGEALGAEQEAAARAQDWRTGN